MCARSDLIDSDAMVQLAHQPAWLAAGGVRTNLRKMRVGPVTETIATLRCVNRRGKPLLSTCDQGLNQAARLSRSSGAGSGGHRL